MYLRRSGWTDDDTFSVRTAAGEVRPRITGELCTMDMGRARLRAESDFPSGRRRRRAARSTVGRARVRLPVRAGRQPAGARSRSATSSRSSTCSATGPAIERNELFPNRTNVSFWRRTGDAEIRARIFERGVGETMSSGTGATGAAVAAVLRGVDEPGDRRARRRRARGRGGRGPARGPDRLGAARLRRNAERRIPEGAECNRVAAWTACPRTCSPSSSGRSREKKAAGRGRDQPRHRRPRHADAARR